MLAAGTLMFVLPQMQTQAYAQAPQGSIHGHVQNAAAMPMQGGDVKLTTDTTPSDLASAKYKFDFLVLATDVVHRPD